MIFKLFNCCLYNKQRQVDWTASANLLKSVYNTLLRFPYIAHLPHLKVTYFIVHKFISKLSVCVATPRFYGANNGYNVISHH